MGAEILTLTNAKTQNITGTCAGWDGLPPWQINAAIAGCDPIGEEILRRKVLAQKPQGEGYRLLYEMVMDKLIRARLLPKRLDVRLVIAQLLELYLEEDTGRILCKTCKGREYIVDRRGVRRKCRRCGDGTVKLNDKERAARLHIKPKTYSRYYSSIYHKMSWFLNPIMEKSETRAYWYITDNLCLHTN